MIMIYNAKKMTKSLQNKESEYLQFVEQQLTHCSAYNTT